MEDGRWQPDYGVRLKPVPRIDVEVSNWYTSTHPGSPFVTSLVAARRGVTQNVALRVTEGTALLFDRSVGGPSEVTPVTIGEVPGAGSKANSGSPASCSTTATDAPWWRRGERRGGRSRDASVRVLCVAYRDAPPGAWRAFVDALPARTAKLAVVRADGSPTSRPFWVDLDGDDVVFMTSADTIKGKAILRDPRVSLCWDDERPPFSFVTIAGSATTSTDPNQLRHWATGSRPGTWVLTCRAPTGNATPSRQRW